MANFVIGNKRFDTVEYESAIAEIREVRKSEQEPRSTRHYNIHLDALHQFVGQLIHEARIMKELQEAVAKLQVLLEEPHVNLTTWNVAVDAQIERIRSLWHSANIETY